MDAAQALHDWRLQPENSQALKVLGLLNLIAEKQGLKPEDWAQINSLACRLVLARRNEPKAA